MVAYFLNQKTNNKTKKLLMLEMNSLKIFFGLVWMTRKKKEDFNTQATNKTSISPIGDMDNQTATRDIMIAFSCTFISLMSTAMENGLTFFAPGQKGSYVSFLDGHKTTWRLGTIRERKKSSL